MKSDLSISQCIVCIVSYHCVFVFMWVQLCVFVGIEGQYWKFHQPDNGAEEML